MTYTHQQVAMTMKPTYVYNSKMPIMTNNLQTPTPKIKNHNKMKTLMKITQSLHKKKSTQPPKNQNFQKMKLTKRQLNQNHSNVVYPIAMTDHILLGTIWLNI